MVLVCCGHFSSVLVRIADNSIVRGPCFAWERRTAQRLGRSKYNLPNNPTAFARFSDQHALRHQPYSVVLRWNYAVLTKMEACLLLQLNCLATFLSRRKSLFCFAGVPTSRSFPAESAASRPGNQVLSGSRHVERRSTYCSRIPPEQVRSSASRVWKENDAERSQVGVVCLLQIAKTCHWMMYVLRVWRETCLTLLSAAFVRTNRNCKLHLAFFSVVQTIWWSKLLSMKLRVNTTKQSLVTAKCPPTWHLTPG